jgi:16S rRNA (cytosine967-C5)-methyltransferase
MTDALPPERLLLASGNAGKLRELRELCRDLGVAVWGPAEWTAESGQELPEVVEDANTFLGNSLKKALSAFRATGLSVVADDSGLCVDALGGDPGVHSARFAGPQADDAANRALLLEKLANVEDGARGAAFLCTLVLCGPLAEGPDAGRSEDGVPWRAFVGRTEGRITRAPAGDGGFGYDRLFLSPELGVTFAQADAAAKNRLSHRGHAFARLATHLASVRRGEPKRPLYVRLTGLHALTRALDLSIARELRYADTALENALGEQPQLGPKERAAVAELHWHALRTLSRLTLARMAVLGAAAPPGPPDPRRLDARDAPLLATLAATDLDAEGAPRSWEKKTGPATVLDGLLDRNPGFNERLKVPRQGLESALRTAAYASRSWSDVEALALELGYTVEFVQACIAQLGRDHTVAALTYMNRRGPLTLRVNSLRTDRDHVADLLRAEGIPTTPIDGLPHALLSLASARLTALPAFQQGLFEIQDEGSQRIAAAVHAQPGETVLDWCAGAGGKTLALAADLRGRGQLVALDTHAKRLSECDRRLKRAGISQAGTRALPRGEGPVPGVPMADAVLIDAPCSSSGALRRNPELRWHVDGEWLGRFPAQQLAILERAARHVKRNGRLIYATCSLMRGENEDVVAAFLARHPDYRKQTEARFGPADSAFLATHPLAHTGPDGFYCCALDRTAPVTAREQPSE